MEFIEVDMCKFHLNRLSMHIEHITERCVLFDVTSVSELPIFNTEFLSGINER